MNNTAQRFGNLLEQKGFPMPIIRIQDRGNETIFIFQQQIKNNMVDVLIDFDEDNTCIDFNTFNLVKLNADSNKEKVYDVLNKFNKNYRFPKFYINEQKNENDENEVSVAAQITIPYEKSVSEEMMFDMLRSMLSFCNNGIEEISNAAQ